VRFGGAKSHCYRFERNEWGPRISIAKGLGAGPLITRKPETRRTHFSDVGGVLSAAVTKRHGSYGASRGIVARRFHVCEMGTRTFA
jgi:hypothetical protein